MPLNRAHVTVPIAGGLATGTDSKLLQPPNVEEMRNIRQGRQGEVIPRFGTLGLGTGLFETSDTLPAPWSLATWKDCLISLSGAGSPHPLNTWSPSGSQWGTDVYSSGQPIGGITTLRRGPVVATPIRVTGSGATPSVAYSSGYYFISYQTTPAAGGSLVLHEVIMDATSGAIIVDRAIDDGLGFVRGAVAVVNGFAVFARQTLAGNIALDRWTIANLDAGPTAGGFAAGLPGTPTAFDWLVKDATTLSLLFEDGTNLACVDFAPSTLVVTAWSPRTSAGAVIARGAAASWMKDLAAAGKIAIVETAGGALHAQWDIALAGATRNATTSFLLDAALPAPVGNVTGTTITSSAVGEFLVLYDSNVTSHSTAKTLMAERIAGVTTAAQPLLRATALRSHVFKQGSDFYVWLEYPSALSSARFCVRIDTAYAGSPTTPGLGGIVAKAQVGQVSVPPFPNTLSPVVSPATNVWTMIDAVQIRLINQTPGYNPFQAGIELLPATFKQAGDTTLGTPREAIDGLYVPGGTLGEFDGSAYAEAGFAYNPETPTLSALAGGGAQTAGVTYYYKFCLAYQLASGRMVRSAPSLPLAVPMGANTKATIAMETLRISERSIPFVSASRKGIILEAYRGGANDNTTFQLAGTVANDTSVDSVTFVDGLSDAVVALGEFLYTNGGGSLPNDIIPGFTSTATAGGRFFGVSADDPQCIWPSAQFIPGIGLRFSEQTKIFIRDQHGPIMGVAAQPNGTVLAFKKDAIYLLSGAGPDQAGRGSFSVQIVAIGLGTINPRSIVETSLGAEFLSTASRAGWWRINLGQAPEYIGAAVERFVGATIVGAVMVPSESATRYYLATGGCLVHNIVTGLWSQDDGAANTTCAAAYAAGAAYGTTTPLVTVDNTDNTDGQQSDPLTGAYTMLATTPWLKLADLRGYQRVIRARGVGEQSDSDSSAAMTVALQKDMIAANVVLQTVPTTLSATWDWEMRYSAKLEAVRYVISAIPNQYNRPDLLKWTAIVVEYGVLPGMRPQASSKRTV